MTRSCNVYLCCPLPNSRNTNKLHCVQRVKWLYNRQQQAGWTNKTVTAYMTLHIKTVTLRRSNKRAKLTLFNGTFCCKLKWVITRVDRVICTLATTKQKSLSTLTENMLCLTAQSSPCSCHLQILLVKSLLLKFNLKIKSTTDNTTIFYWLFEYIQPKYL